MNRYYLDTNIIIFLVFGELDNLSIETKNILSDYENRLYASVIAITELLQLHRIGKVKFKLYTKQKLDLVFNKR